MLQSKLSSPHTEKEYTFETDSYLILRSMLRLFYVIEKKMFLSVKQVGTSILCAIFNNK